MPSTTNLLSLFLLFFSISLTAQKEKTELLPEETHHQSENHKCATPDMTPEQNKSIMAFSQTVNKTVGFTQLPVRIHIVTRDDGTGGISLDDINIAMANLNTVYRTNNLEFFIANVNYIASTQYFDYSQSEEVALCAANQVNDAVNVFFVDKITTNSGGLACGYAYYPGNGTYSLRILMDNGCTAGFINGTFVHEFGHFFNLPHTHNGTSNGNAHSNAEHVPRTGANSNCLTNGDYVCDTEADPRGGTTNCVFDSGATDIHGNLYTPNVDNIMSYYSDGCGGIFTPNQYTRINGGIATRLAHTAYNLDGAPPVAVNNPSGLTATASGTAAILNWTDNSTNETGFLIERSDDGGTTYAPIAYGGVAENVTTYTGSGLNIGQTYWFRIKASNDNPNDYSSPVSVTTEDIFTCANAKELNSCGTFQSPQTNIGNGASQSDATHATWFEFTPPYTGTVDIYTCLQGVDTRLWIHNSCGGSILGSSDDDCELTPGGNEYASEVLNLSVTKDVPIFIEWDNKWTSNSAFSFNIDLTATNTCDVAIDLTAAGTYSVESISCGGDANQSDATNSVWYKFTPNSTGNLEIKSCNQSVNTRLWVYGGTCASLSNLGSSDDGCGTASTLTLAVTNNVPIFIEWDDKWSSEGFDFEINYTTPGDCPPSYDLTGTQSVTKDFETNGDIISNQLINNNATIDYDSRSSISLNPDFEVTLGAIFEAFIDGCGGSK